ncbi:MAG TPA: hypothetical protein VM198_09935 [Longimicrobiales bacterium]|nr:hypothetical protein [Longimicrobiales bacterium]
MHSNAKLIAPIALPLVAVLGCISSADVTFPEEREILFGTARVEVTTSGENQDVDGYLVIIDESLSERVAVNASVTFSPLLPGDYQVTLSEVAGNCAIQGTGPTQDFTVAGGGTTHVVFTVSCS